MSQQTVQFNRDTLARWNAQLHLKTDLGITEVIYLPYEANDRDIRFFEINETMLDDGKSRQLFLLILASTWVQTVSTAYGCWTFRPTNGLQLRRVRFHFHMAGSFSRYKASNENE